MMDDMVPGSSEGTDEVVTNDTETTEGDKSKKTKKIETTEDKTCIVSVVNCDDNGSELISRELKDAAAGGLSQFTKMNTKILELVSHNNVLLLEKIREVEENCGKQLKEKDEQIKKLLHSNKEYEQIVTDLSTKQSTQEELDYL